MKEIRLMSSHYESWVLMRYFPMKLDILSAIIQKNIPIGASRHAMTFVHSRSHWHNKGITQDRNTTEKSMETFRAKGFEETEKLMWC